MFDDPKKYFQTFTNMVNSCRFIEHDSKILEGPNAIPSWEEWDLITLELECKFHSGERLEVFEGYSRINLTKTVKRNYVYRFMKASGSLIFMMDTHGVDVDDDVPCHLHLEAEEQRISDGDPRLNGFSLIGQDFLTVFPLVYDHLEGRAFPWEQN